MNLSQNGGLAAIQAVGAQANGGTLPIYGPPQPSAPENSPSGTLLATFNFASNAFPSPMYDAAQGFYKAQGTFSSSTVTPIASGTACFARMLQSDTAVIADLTLGQSWAPNLPVVANQYICANGNLYRCSTGGTTAGSGTGPTGTMASIQDGSAYWMFMSVGAADIVLTTTTLLTTTPVNLPYLWLAIPCQ